MEKNKAACYRRVPRRTRQDKTIEYNITIATAQLDGTRTDRYGNGRITHCQRNFVTSTVTNLLNDVLIETVRLTSRKPTKRG